MEKGWAENLARWLTIILVFVIVGVGLLLIWPTYQRNQELQRRDQELTERIEQKRREIEKLNENQRRFKTEPDFVEQIARENRRVFPGELMFVFEKDK